MVRTLNRKLLQDTHQLLMKIRAYLNSMNLDIIETVLYVQTGILDTSMVTSLERQLLTVAFLILKFN